APAPGAWQSKHLEKCKFNKPCFIQRASRPVKTEAPMASASTFRPYRLSCSLLGHEKDVKALCSVTSPALSGAACIASASRDRTARVWSPDLAAQDGAVGYTECLGLCSHAGYVNAVAWMDPCDWCPGGLLYTAGMDKVIFAFTLDSPEPVARLEGHEANVCGLSCAGPHGSSGRQLLSASWDRTARLWRRNRCVAVFRWRPRGGGLVRYQLRPGGGAGRHGRGGQTDQAPQQLAKPASVTTLSGHFDAVRGLCRLPNRRFVSCSNDATLRLWHLHATSSQMTFEGHAGFVYAVAALPDPDADGDVLHFASASEDRTCRLWSVETGACLQALTMPCQSIWAVCWLVNGDLAVAGSDAAIRVFTAEAHRLAPPDLLAVYEAEVADSAIPVKIGDLDTEKLPGPEALTRAAEGQVIMVRRGAKIEAHQWSNEEAKWQKVGDVVGGEGGETVNSGGGGGGGSGGRTRFEGQDYDFVFTVDVEEGKPPLKLPYNRTEDPWFAAQRFIDKHLLPQAYLDQVAQFIRTNAGETPTISQGTYADPYTGSGRYIPGSGTSDGGTGRGFSDPFTGGNRYVPGGAGVGGGASGERGVTPELKANWQHGRLRKKLGELAASVPADLPDRLDALVESGISQGDSADARLILSIADTALNGASDCSLPLLDVLRMACRFPVAAQILLESGSATVAQLLAKFLSPSSSLPCQMLAARLLANLAATEAGKAWLVGNFKSVLELIDQLDFAKENAGWQTAVSSALCNLSQLVQQQAECPESSADRLLELLHRMLAKAGSALKDEPAFLVVVSVGNLLLTGPGPAVLAKDLGLKPLLHRFTDTSYSVRLTEAATVVSCQF
uniref:WD_REPEATS_REGION domain-containing protein n=1 Tax=Macrostomum lignano TaxID=282301 RepID=A0A1I8IG95_9PLAT